MTEPGPTVLTLQSKVQGICDADPEVRLERPCGRCDPGYQVGITRDDGYGMVVLNMNRYLSWLVLLMVN